MKHFFVVLFLLLFLVSNLTFSQSSIDIGVHGPVDYVLIDPLGKREGINPLIKQRYREINGSYGVFSLDSEDSDEPAPEPVNEFYARNPVEGFYRLTLYGVELYRYRLFLSVDAQGKGKGIETHGTIDSGQTRVFEFHYSRDSSAPLIVKRYITGSTLREDLASCFKLGYLGDHALYKHLSERVEHIEKRLERQDSSKAADELEKLNKELKKELEEVGRGKGKTRKRFVTQEAYEMLKDDIDILLSSLPKGKRGKEDERPD